MLDLGRLYRDGNGVQKHLGRARSWWRKSAALGCREAKRELARLQR
jgi:TPR repeat protein